MKTNQRMDFVRAEQDNYLRFYRHAMDCFDEGKDEEAKRAIVCAAGTLIDIAARVSSDVRPSFTDKAKRLLEYCALISETPYEKLFCSIEDELMGLNLSVNEIPKELVEPKKVKEMDKIAGLEDAKAEIDRKVIYPMKYPSLFKRYGKETGGGILLYGLPGTGKTMIARAIAKDADADFIPIKCSDLFSKWFGESESNVKEYFERARKSKRAILFFDEFEAIGGRRTGSTDNALNRIVPELLAQMQGVENECNPQIVLMAATNRPWDIDSAFLRSGRFGTKVYVPLPDAKARETIIKTSISASPKDDAIRLGEIVAKTNGYNGADVHELCEAAKMYAIEREIKTKKKSVLGMDDLLRAIATVGSSVSKEDLKEMNRYRENNKSFAS